MTENLPMIDPSISKLVDYVASGIGAVAGPMLAPWAAKRRAKAKLIESSSQADSLLIIAQAQATAKRMLTRPASDTQLAPEEDDPIFQRLQYQDRKRHQNIVSVVSQAANTLVGSEVPDHEPDHDWTARFFEFVQDVFGR